MKSNFFIWAILILPFKSVFAQTDLEAKAPTLQVGLDGFSFAKGSLDAQLIIEIVAEKQKELKVKAIQNVFLDKVFGTGGTVYTYVDNVVRELVFEPDQQVRTKKILENTVNLVFTMSYLNFYLASLEKNSTARKNIVELACELACIYNSDSVLIDIKDKLIKKDSLNITDFSIKPRPIKGKRTFKDEYAVIFIALLIDMTSKAIREDRTLKQLGLMQVAYSETYEYLNLYNDNKLIYNEDSLILHIKLLADSVYKNMRETLNSFTNFIGIVNYLVEGKALSKFSTIEDLNVLVQKQDSSLKADIQKLEKINKSLKSLINKLESEYPSALSKFSTIEGVNVLVQKQDSSLKADIQNLVKIYFYIDKAIKQIEATKSQTDNTTRLKTYADILYTLNSDFIPLLKNQSFRSVKYIDIIDSMNLFNSDFFTHIISTNQAGSNGSSSKKQPDITQFLPLVSKLYQLDSASKVLKKYQSEIPQFLQLVSKLYQFDRGSTISEYMKLLDDIGTTFPDDNVRNSLSTVLKFVKDYSVIEKNNNNKEVFSFNVESFLYKLQTIKPYKLNRVTFLFTVGVNNAMFCKDLVLPDSSISRNLSFVGEKVGVKYIIKDWAFSRTRNPGETFQIKKYKFIRYVPPKEPIVSNWHLMAYGSGILYNLVNTKTQKEFNMPIIGVGSGLTFYNGLDFNISWGVPIMANRPISSNNDFWNIGLDIQFIEYYDRLMEKRKNNQIQKRLVEAQKN